MYLRFRYYRSGAEALGDLARLDMCAPAADGMYAPIGLFAEGREDEIEPLLRRAKEEGLAASNSSTGHHPRLCVLGDPVGALSIAEDLFGPEMVRRVLSAYSSDDAPAVSIPGGKLTFNRPLVMGILNVTPDSFSDGGSNMTAEASMLRALAMAEEGADLIDVGGESTRPGASPVPLEEELRRTVPVIKEIAERTDVPISIDTMKPEVARAAIQAGARVINDVSGLRSREMAELAADTGVPVVLMHMLGEPATMQQTVSVESYDDVISDIMWFWEERMETAGRYGLEREQIILDPGIGFGKLLEHNIEILERTRELRSCGRPVLIGASRKGLVSRLSGDTRERRTGGSLAAAAVAVLNGASVVRAHDVPETVGALRFIDAIRRSR